MNMEMWMQFLNAETEEEYEALKQTGDPIMQEAVDAIYEMSEDPQIQEEVRLREKALHDEASALKGARDEGKAEGENLMLARMKAAGMSDSEINRILSINL